MTVLEAILMGIIQGITEFLPISSSGHLVLFRNLFGMKGEGSLFFSVMLHLGTLVAVIAAYYEDVWAIIKEVGYCVRDIFRGRFSFKTDNPHRKLLFMLVLATLPLVLVLLFKGGVEKVTQDNDIVLEGFFFLITAGLLFLSCKVKPGRAKIRQMKPQTAVAIGVVQSLAAFPGISRSGSTISAGTIFGFDRQFMVKFSFLMSIPAILGSAVFEIGDAVEQGVNVKFLPVALGILAAAVFGYISIQFMRRFIMSKYFVVFAWYALCLGILVIIIGTVQHVAGGGDPSGTTSFASSIASSISDAATGSVPPA